MNNDGKIATQCPIELCAKGAVLAFGVLGAPIVIQAYFANGPPLNAAVEKLAARSNSLSMLSAVIDVG